MSNDGGFVDNDMFGSLGGYLFENFEEKDSSIIR